MASEHVEVEKVNEVKKEELGDSTVPECDTKVSSDLLYGIASILIVPFFICAFGYDGRLSLRYVGVGLFVVIVLCCLVAEIRCSICVNKNNGVLNKDVVSKFYGSSIVEECFTVNNADAFFLFDSVIAGRILIVKTIIGSLFVATVGIIIFSLMQISVLSMFTEPYYLFKDFFIGGKIDTVTYIGDAEHVEHGTRANLRRRLSSSSTVIRTYYLVNFQTSDGEILTIRTNDSEFLEESRTFDNTELKYYPRNGAGVHEFW